MGRSPLAKYVLATFLAHAVWHLAYSGIFRFSVDCGHLALSRITKYTWYFSDAVIHENVVVVGAQPPGQSPLTYNAHSCFFVHHASHYPRRGSSIVVPLVTGCWRADLSKQLEFMGVPWDVRADLVAAPWLLNGRVISDTCPVEVLKDATLRCALPGLVGGTSALVKERPARNLFLNELLSKEDATSQNLITRAQEACLERLRWAFPELFFCALRARASR